MPEINPDWRRRGYVCMQELSLHIHLSDIELIMLLKSNEAINRTIAATILGNRKQENAVDPLIKALKKEKALYSKITISEALVNLGDFAVSDLILLLGKIGNNQHKTLPVKPFEKWNYPLSRDIAARILSKIGISALNPILKTISKMDKKAVSEAIDAIGFITFYCNNKSAYQHLLSLLDLYKNDDLILWKIIRSLESFPKPETEKILDYFLEYHCQPAIRWEAARSLAQICKNPSDGLLFSSKDKNELVKKMSLFAINRISLNYK